MLTTHRLVARGKAARRQPADCGPAHRVQKVLVVETLTSLSEMLDLVSTETKRMRSDPERPSNEPRVVADQNPGSDPACRKLLSNTPPRFVRCKASLPENVTKKTAERRLACSVPRHPVLEQHV